MPVDPLEEARERLEKLAASIDGAPPNTKNVVGPATATAIRAILAELDRRSPPTREGEGTDVATVRDWLASLPGLVMDEIAADGGVTVAMVVQQEAREMAARLDRALAAAPPPPDGEVETQYSSLRFAPQPALGGKPPLDEPESAAGAWNAEQIAHFLFGLLDDIDTASDIAKADDALYRALVAKGHRRRFEVASTDGYTVTFTPAPAQPQETHDLGASNTLQGAQGAPAGSAPADTGRGE